MRKRTVRSVLIDVDTNSISEVEIDDELDAYYELLNCRCIDITTRPVAGTYYDIMCDDEGLLQSNPKPSAIDENGKVQLVGNLMLFHHDSEGNLTSLTDKDIERIKERVLNVRYNAGTGLEDGIVLLLGNTDIVRLIDWRNVS